MLQDKPSKKDFADLINQITGEKTMTEKKLDQILHGAKKSFQHQGMEGLFDYLRKVVQAPVSNEWMEKTWKQMQTADGAKQMLKQLQLPTESLIPSTKTKQIQSKKRKKK